MSSILDRCAEIEAEEARKRAVIVRMERKEGRKEGMRFSSKYGLHDRITIAGDIRALITAVQFSGGGRFTG